MIRSLPISWSSFYLFLFIYRCVFSVLGELVVMRLTNIGDTVDYQNADLLEALSAIAAFSTDEFGIVMVVWATIITEFAGGIFGLLFFDNPILINMGFQTIAFAGIHMLLKSVEPSVRRPLAILVALPSFTLWTSIAAKESIVAFLMCVVGTYIVGFYYNRARLRLYHLAALALLYVFKPHFMIALAFVLVGGWVAKAVRQKTAVAILGAALSAVLLYLFRDEIDGYALQITGWLTSDIGGSSRPAYLIEPYDMFVKAPYGMLQSFIGPTADEASRSVLHLLSFVESMAMIAVLGFLAVRDLPRLPVYSLVIGLGTTFWILFITYPFGMPNPGSAVRYRSDYAVLVFVAFAFLMSRDLFVSWRRGVRRGPAGSDRVARPTPAPPPTPRRSPG